LTALPGNSFTILYASFLGMVYTISVAKISV
jgi:hypothetical protein